MPEHDYTDAALVAAGERLLAAEREQEEALALRRRKMWGNVAFFGTEVTLIGLTQAALAVRGGWAAMCVFTACAAVGSVFGAAVCIESDEQRMKAGFGVLACLSIFIWAVAGILL